MLQCMARGWACPASAVLDRQGSHRHLRRWKQVAKRHPGAVVQPATGIGGHQQAGVLQSFHHLLGGPGAAAGRDLDLVELRIESS
jgi:hypothetical protein